MTREQADNILENIDVIEGCNTRYLCRDVENLIDKIYDDIENRTCNNCKSRHCDIKRDLLERGCINPDYFSCNDWEQK